METKSLLDRHSEFLLEKVHPDLVRVIHLASQTPQGFQVVQGVRTLTDEQKAVKTGHSTTLHSRHLPHAGDGLSRAVDVAAIINGKLSFAAGEEERVFGQIWKQIADAADTLQTPVEWGGNWRTFKDYGHIQLPWNIYT